MNVSVSDLLAIIGEKEVTILTLKNQVAQLQKELADKTADKTKKPVE